jgi:hypothetical protein
MGINIFYSCNEDARNELFNTKKTVKKKPSEEGFLLPDNFLNVTIFFVIAVNAQYIGAF